MIAKYKKNLKRDEKILELHQQGYSYTQIARELKYSITPQRAHAIVKATKLPS